MPERKPPEPALEQIFAARRAQRLAPPGVISQQELDNALEGLRTAEAGYRQTRALQEYALLRAPFDGVVTARAVDPGAMVAPGTALFQMADARRLRVQTYVAQDAAPFVRVGDDADIAEEQRPGRVVRAQVSRLAAALDPRS